MTVDDDHKQFGEIMDKSKPGFLDILLKFAENYEKINDLTLEILDKAFFSGLNPYEIYILTSGLFSGVESAVLEDPNMSKHIGSLREVCALTDKMVLEHIKTLYVTKKVDA